MNRESDNEEVTTRRTGVWMFLIAFGLFLALMTWIFSDVLERKENPNIGVSGAITDAGVREIVLQRNAYGHYVVRGTINDQEVTFFLDTGATTVSIPAFIADRIGLERGVSVMSETAAGVVENFSTRLAKVTLGPIEISDIRGTINPHTESDQILLGMTFLKDLEIIQRGRELMLRQYE